MPLIKSFLILTTISFITGCSTIQKQSKHRATDSPYAYCESLYQNLDQITAKYQTTDSQASRIPSFPYLRINRFFSQFRNQPLNAQQFNDWITQLHNLDKTGRRIEIANLPQNIQNSLPNDTAISQCQKQLLQRDMASPERKQALIEAAIPPQEYQTWRRFLGLYWLTAWPAKIGVHHMQKAIKKTFQIPIDQQKIHGQLVSYHPPINDHILTSEDIEVILKKSATNPLSIPKPDSQVLNQLFDAFAPTWQIDTLNPDDKIGSPEWKSGNNLHINTQQPVVYRHPSYARFQGKTLLQLNYIIWFPSRPLTSAFDILGGNLDGITWRVTLAENGQPLVYDTIHNCGCYHLLFPAQKLCLKAPDSVLQEPLFAPKQAPDSQPGHGPVVRIAHTSHFVDQISDQSVVAAKHLAYQWADYDHLRSLPTHNKQRKSLFQTNGIIPGTERGERWILWPMGIPGPGEMRQWGHHAIAFLGRRHFDDADLLDRAFIDSPQGCY